MNSEKSKIEIFLQHFNVVYKIGVILFICSIKWIVEAVKGSSSMVVLVDSLQGAFPHTLHGLGAYMDSWTLSLAVVVIGLVAVFLYTNSKPKVRVLVG